MYLLGSKVTTGRLVYSRLGIHDMLVFEMAIAVIKTAVLRDKGLCKQFGVMAHVLRLHGSYYYSFCPGL
jgi:hypothetical protein